MLALSLPEKVEAASSRLTMRITRLGSRVYIGLALLDGYVRVAICQRFAVLFDLQSITVEDSNGDMLSSKFDCAVVGRNPAFERRADGFVIYYHAHISFLERPDSDAVGAF